MTLHYIMYVLWMAYGCMLVHHSMGTF